MKLLTSSTVLSLLSVSVLLASAVVFAAPPTPIKPAMPVAKVDYNHDIRPILAGNCFACHGQDAAARQANLRLDTRETATAARSGSRAIEPGKPEKSALVSRINAENSPLLMPPASSNHKLTPHERTLLTEWVRQGALYDTHWAFKQLTQPSVPPVRNRGWVRSPIDAFVLARLERIGLSPAPEADRCTWIRRVSLDLTGLPPTPADVDAFLKDRSPDAYEKVVDRLLNSPHYGEHWARMWLDLARYADTQGYEKDLQRTIWRYRDWVIDAFNADMPYDQFTIEQLAGDLLPHPTESQLLATAFHRNTMTNTEGGVDNEEFRVAAVKDRVDTTAQVWMGLTMGCAKCHSHKYDPITQTDYYRFYALFNQTEDANRFDEAPTAPMPTEDQKKRLAAADEKLKRLQDAFWKETPGQKERQAAWESSLATSSLWNVLRPESATAESGAILKLRADGALVVSGPHAEKDAYTLTFVLPAGKVSSIRLEALKDPSLPNGGPGRNAGDQNVVTSEFVVEQIAPGQAQRTPITLQAARADFEQQGYKVGSATDGNPDTGWAWAPQNSQPHVAVFDFKSPVTLPGGKLVVTIKQNYSNLQHGCFRLSVSGSDAALLKAELRPLSELAALPVARRTPEEQKRLDEAFRQTNAPTAAIYHDLAAAEKEHAAIDAEIPRIPILKELAKDKQRVTHIQKRGNFLDPGDVVTPAIPEAFGPMPAGAPENRLGAAEWLVSKNNPLTPRVLVNRVWARLFGTGLVETEEDFGTQGTPPTHPQLLDWLAITFRDDLGWSMKKLCKTIVMSATYRQSGETTTVKRKADPRNLLLSRGPRFRLPAEVLRDQALAVSGLLSEKLHGPSVMPPQPDGIWRTVYSGMKWQTSSGEDRYRRALYTFWRRSSPYPSMTTFDAGSGEFCVIRRVRTNTPLQALVTLNDPAFVEAAGALGKAMLAAPVDGVGVPGKHPLDPAQSHKVSFAAAGADVRSRLVTGFRRVLARSPDPAELARLTRLYDAALLRFRQKPDTAQALLKAANSAPLADHGIAEQAAYDTVANVLLNLDETLTKP